MTRMARLVLTLAPVPLMGTAPVPKERNRVEDPNAFPRLGAREWQARPGGLKVWDVTRGKGEEVKPGASVTVRYIGWLTDGTVFDGTHKDPSPQLGKGEPVTFGLDSLIRGWRDGLVGMKVGGVRRLLIPPELAYGEQGAGRGIPPNATLVFTIEVMKVENR
jgi:FKBP-type peptidyl-prolyl cis-trans isomerase